MPRERRFHAENVEDDALLLDEQESHHLLHVLRLPVGAEVVVFDGRGTARRATFLESEGGRARLRLGERLPANESPLELTVAVSVPGGAATRLLVEKLTEVGVHEIQPLVADRDERGAHARPRRANRWRQITVAAAKQCARSRLPRVEPLRTLDQVLERRDPACTTSIALHPGAPPLEAPFEPKGAVLLAVGPPGGWSPREEDLLRAQGVLARGLGPRILRTETAAITASALIQWLAGDWS